MTATPQADPGQRIRELLQQAPAGLHRFGEPAYLFDSEWPAALVCVYRAFDGAELYHGELELFPARDVRKSEGRFHVGEMAGQLLAVDTSGGVFSWDPDGEIWLPEGAEFSRWLWGWVEAQLEIVDADGEFREDIFDEEGEPTAALQTAMCERILRRDKAAPAPRWRLARTLRALGKREQARDELERVVAAAPAFAWGWYDLCRISEALGEVETALDEADAAARAETEPGRRAYFWATAARLARLANSRQASEFAELALRDDPNLVRAHHDACEQCIAEDDPTAAREHLELALALRPTDLTLLSLRSRIPAQPA